MLFLHQTVLFYVYNSVKMTKSVVKGRTLSHPLIFYNIIGNESVLLWSEALRLSKKNKKNFSDCNVLEAAGKSSHVDAPISSLPTVCRRKSLSMEKSHWSVKVNTIYCTWPPCWGHRGPRQHLWQYCCTGTELLRNFTLSPSDLLPQLLSKCQNILYLQSVPLCHLQCSQHTYCRSVLTSVLWMEDVFRSSGPLGDLWSSPSELSILTDSSTDAACLLHVLYVCRF